MKERRTHARFPVGEWGQLQPLEWEFLIGRSKAQIVNVSEGGIGLLIEQAIPKGTAVRIILNSGSYLGKIVHCKPSGRSFIAGVSVHTSTKSIPRQAPATATTE